MEEYDVREPIGKGSFAEVFLAYKRGHAKPYVLKRIKLARQTRWQRDATMREIKLMQSLSHPFVVPFVECWTHNSHTVNVVLGYCEQGDLATLMHRRKNKPFDEPQLRRWMAQLLLALDYLEQQQVLHRDVKTGNIFLCAEGHVQLGDLGLASWKDKDDANAQHDQSLVGTPHFMSPELLSQKGYSHQTDVWSLGCVMYELTAGRPAFNAFNLSGLIQKITRSSLAPMPSTYSADWQGIVKSMLRKDPVARPTVQQLLALPSLQHAVAEARRLARALQPGVYLPAMPQSPQPSGQQPHAERSSSGGGRDGAGAGEAEGAERASWAGELLTLAGGLGEQPQGDVGPGAGGPEAGKAGGGGVAAAAPRGGARDQAAARPRTAPAAGGAGASGRAARPASAPRGGGGRGVVRGGTVGAGGRTGGRGQAPQWRSAQAPPGRQAAARGSDSSIPSGWGSGTKEASSPTSGRAPGTAGDAAAGAGAAAAAVAAAGPASPPAASPTAAAARAAARAAAAAVPAAGHSASKAAATPPTAQAAAAPSTGAGPAHAHTPARPAHTLPHPASTAEAVTPAGAQAQAHPTPPAHASESAPARSALAGGNASGGPSRVSRSSSSSVRRETDADALEAKQAALQASLQARLALEQAALQARREQQAARLAALKEHQALLAAQHQERVARSREAVRAATSRHSVSRSPARRTPSPAPAAAPAAEAADAAAAEAAPVPGAAEAVAAAATANGAHAGAGAGSEGPDTGAVWVPGGPSKPAQAARPASAPAHRGGAAPAALDPAVSVRRLRQGLSVRKQPLPHAARAAASGAPAAAGGLSTRSSASGSSTGAAAPAAQHAGALAHSGAGIAFVRVPTTAAATTTIPPVAPAGPAASGVIDSDFEEQAWAMAATAARLAEAMEQQPQHQQPQLVRGGSYAEAGSAGGPTALPPRASPPLPPSPPPCSSRASAGSPPRALTRSSTGLSLPTPSHSGLNLYPGPDEGSGNDAADSGALPADALLGRAGGGARAGGAEGAWAYHAGMEGAGAGAAAGGGGGPGQLASPKGHTVFQNTLYGAARSPSEPDIASLGDLTARPQLPLATPPPRHHAAHHPAGWRSTSTVAAAAAAAIASPVGGAGGGLEDWSTPTPRRNSQSPLEWARAAGGAVALEHSCSGGSGAHGSHPQPLSATDRARLEYLEQVVAAAQELAGTGRHAELVALLGSVKPGAPAGACG